MNIKRKYYFKGFNIVLLILSGLFSSAQAQVNPEQIRDRLTIFVENTIGLLPEGTPAKKEALAAVTHFSLLSAKAMGWAEGLSDEVYIAASQANQFAAELDQALAGVPAEVAAAIDAVFVSTSGTITYEGTNQGVPGIVVGQGLKWGDGNVMVLGLSITDFQGNYTIIYPGNVVAMFDGVPDMQITVRPVYTLSKSTPTSWDVNYDASGVLSKTQVNDP